MISMFFGCHWMHKTISLVNARWRCITFGARGWAYWRRIVRWTVAITLWSIAHRNWPPRWRHAIIIVVIIRIIAIMRWYLRMCRRAITCRSISCHWKTVATITCWWTCWIFWKEGEKIRIFLLDNRFVAYWVINSFIVC